MDFLIIFVTCNNKDEANKISLALLEQRLAACVNIVDHIESLFHWQGKVDRADEVLLMIKTRSQLFEDVKNAVKGIHSYDVPEIIGMPIVQGDEQYLDWINNETRE